MSNAKEGYATPSLKELWEVRSLLKIMTTIISKARSVKQTIKWWLAEMKRGYFVQNNY